MFGAGQSVEAAGPLARLPDGRYRAGFRANHLELGGHTGAALDFRGTVAVTEITGSETFVHLDHGEDRWIALVEGIHRLSQGDEVQVFLDPAHVHVFDETGAFVAQAASAAAA
jgi:glycerol transport system ATP-binding protein